MIIYLRHDEIDREQWDNCVKYSPGSKPYGYSWYLDIMAPGWEALIDDDYDSVFPVPGFKKYGIKYIATPVFLQQLGAYSPDKSPQKAINEFIEYLPDFYWLTDLCTAQRIDNDRYRVTLKANYELDLNSSYDKLWDRFSGHCRRNIEKSVKKKISITGDIKPVELIGLFQDNAGKKIRGIKQRDYHRLNTLMDFCIKNKKGRILGVRASKKKIIYGMFVIEIKGSKTMLFVVNTQESREKRLGYYMVNELIKESAGTRTVLDFAGSSVPSIAAFMESFGSYNVPYYRHYRNMLPWPIRLLK
ncbi:MAG TPA: hypothetical protein DDW27_21005 [Bacteroidales bacterium]|nr:hypothetical protein [Bacteroidales bacterium]